MFHIVNANVLDKSRKEIARKHPLWKGDVENAKQAIGAAHALLGPIFEGEQRADSIVLHILPEKGGAIMSTEYAEDWRIGRGASLGDSLLAQNADHGLTEEEVTAAQEALTKRAVAAMPSIAKKVAEKADPLREFFGGTLPSERKSEEELSEESVSVVMGGDVLAESAQDVFKRVMQNELDEHHGRKFRDVVKRVADKQDEKLRAAGVAPVVAGLSSPRQQARDFSLSDLIDAAEQIKRAVGANPVEVVMGRDAYDSLQKQLSPDGKRVVADFQGMKIRVNDAPGAPPIQMVPEPRRTGRPIPPPYGLGKGEVFVKRADDVTWEALGEVKDFKMEYLQEPPHTVYDKPCKFDFKMTPQQARVLADAERDKANRVHVFSGRGPGYSAYSGIREYLRGSAEYKIQQAEQHIKVVQSTPMTEQLRRGPHRVSQKRHPRLRKGDIQTMKIQRTYPQPDSPQPHIGPRERALAVFKYLMNIEPEQAREHKDFPLLEAAFEQAERVGWNGAVKHLGVTHEDEDLMPSLVPLITGEQEIEVRTQVYGKE